MSHFTVLVIGDNPEEQLQPYHEFECTGTNDEYVQDIDKTDEAREQYERETVTIYRMGDRKLERFDSKGNYSTEPLFWRDLTDEENAAKQEVFHEWEIPALAAGNKHRIRLNKRPDEVIRAPMTDDELRAIGVTITEEPLKDHEDFVTWYQGYYGGGGTVPFGQQPDLEGTHKYGYVMLNEDGSVLRCVDRTNPNRKWDWYVLGGRWTGHFKLKDGVNGVTGRPGLMTDPAKPGYADQCQKADIDIDGMRDEAAERALKNFDEVVACIAGRSFLSWREVCEKICGAKPGEEGFDRDKIEEARKFMGEQEVIQDLRKARLDPWMGDIKDIYCNFDRERYEKQVRDGALSTFAIVMDGKWYEKGTMGWWGVVHGEKDEDDWNTRFAKLFDDLPDDTLLGLYDCHI